LKSHGTAQCTAGYGRGKEIDYRWKASFVPIPGDDDAVDICFQAHYIAQF